MKWQTLVGGALVLFGLNGKDVQAQSSKFSDDMRPTTMGEKYLTDEYKSGDLMNVHYAGIVGKNYVELWESFKDLNGDGKYTVNERTGFAFREDVTNEDGGSEVYKGDVNFIEEIPQTTVIYKDNKGEIVRGPYVSHLPKEFVQKKFNTYKHGK